MPFSRYLDDPEQQDDLSQSNVDFTSNARAPSVPNTSDVFSTNVHFQVPQLMMGPTVASGGGAEALPTGLLPNPDAFSASWAATSAVASLYVSTLHIPLKI